MANSQKLRRVSDGHAVVVDPFGDGRTFREYCADVLTRGPQRVVVVYVPAGAGAWCELVCGHWRFLSTAPRAEPQRVECRLCGAVEAKEDEAMIENVTPSVLASFEKAFRTGGAGCREECNCGRVFYNPGNGWTWEDGEIEALTANPNATSVDYAVERVAFEGKRYVLDCDCWKPRARQLITFIREHDEEIARFLTNEKKRKTAEAERSPEVGVGR